MRQNDTKRIKKLQAFTTHLRAFTSGLCSTEGHTSQARVSTCIRSCKLRVLYGVGAITSNYEHWVSLSSLFLSDIYQDKASVDKKTIGLLQQQALHSATGITIWAPPASWCGQVAQQTSRLRANFRSKSVAAQATVREPQGMENAWKCLFFLTSFEIFSLFARGKVLDQTAQFILRTLLNACAYLGTADIFRWYWWWHRVILEAPKMDQIPCSSPRDLWFSQGRWRNSFKEFQRCPNCNSSVFSEWNEPWEANRQNALMALEASK